MNDNKDKIILIVILVTTLILGLFIIYTTIKQNSNEQTTSPQKDYFKTLTNNENSVEFQVTPLSASEFDISINTHSVELDFDLMKISTLFDDLGNSYKPLQWQGSAPGGHHISGILKFSSINSNAKSIKLLIADSAKREFTWELDNQNG